MNETEKQTKIGDRIKMIENLLEKVEFGIGFLEDYGKQDGTNDSYDLTADIEELELLKKALGAYEMGLNEEYAREALIQRIKEGKG